jgi:hypothetical protein
VLGHISWDQWHHAARHGLLNGPIWQRRFVCLLNTATLHCWVVCSLMHKTGLASLAKIPVAGEVAVITRKCSPFTNCRVPQDADANVV